MYTCYTQRLRILASFSSWVGWFESYLVKISEDTFSRDVAQLIDSNQVYRAVKGHISWNSRDHMTKMAVTPVYCYKYSFPESNDRWYWILAFSIWAATWQNQQSDCAPSEDSDQPGHPPCLIRVFAVCMKKPWVLSYLLSAQRRLWSDWADAQADPSLRWAHMPHCWFCHEAAHLVFMYLRWFRLAFHFFIQMQNLVPHIVEKKTEYILAAAFSNY